MSVRDIRKAAAAATGLRGAVSGKASKTDDEIDGEARLDAERVLAKEAAREEAILRFAVATARTAAHKNDEDGREEAGSGTDLIRASVKSGRGGMGRGGGRGGRGGRGGLSPKSGGVFVPRTHDAISDARSRSPVRDRAASTPVHYKPSSPPKLSNATLDLSGSVAAVPIEESSTETSASDANTTTPRVVSPAPPPKPPRPRGSSPVPPPKPTRPFVYSAPDAASLSSAAKVAENSAAPLNADKYEEASTTVDNADTSTKQPSVVPLEVSSDGTTESEGGGTIPDTDTALIADPGGPSRSGNLV